MSNVKLNSTGGGSVTVSAPATASNYTVTLPAATSTLLDTTSTQTLTNKTLTAAGSNTVEATSGPTSSQLAGNRNKIINGAMMIDQRNAGASVSNSASRVYTLDRWAMLGSASSKFSVQQNAGSVTPPIGFKNYLGVTSLAATSVGASDYYLIQQRVEGFNAADLSWGTSGAASVALSFWVRSSLTGTFGGSIRNSAGDRSYPFSFAISAANTWEQKTVIIVGDITGTWLTDNGIGLDLAFGLGNGSSFSGTANAWQAGNYHAPTGATSVVGTNGATFYLTGVQLEKGATATPFENRLYGTELALCQRYYYKHSSGASVVIGTLSCYSTTRIDCVVKFPVTMRSSPTFEAASGTNFFQGYAGSYSQQFSTILLNSAQPNAAILYNAAVSGYTAGAAGWVENVNSSAYTAFNSEL